MASTASSTLKLVINKGPRNGETLEFNPRSKIRLGRVVRGNNLAIKDSGISSKHLSIEFNSDSCKWEITDLESSNGTLLNSSQLKPFSPFELQNGDEIKIGELTSIRVEIIEVSDEISIRRNQRRQAAPKSGLDLGGKVEVGASGRLNFGGKGEIRVKDLKEEDAEKGVDNRRRRGRGRSKKVSVVEDGNADNDESLGVSENVENVKPKQGCGVGTRRTRSSKTEPDELSGQVEIIPARRTRSAKNVENVTVSSVLEKVTESDALGEVNSKEAENIGLVENKKRTGRGRKKKVVAECLDDTDMKNREVSELPVASVSKQTCEERVDDTAQHNMVEEPNRDVMELEVQDDVEGVELVREKPCKEPTDDTQKTMLETANGEVSELPVASAREQTCEQQADDTAQCNIFENSNRDDPKLEVPEQAEGVVLVGEQLREEPTDDTQKTMLETTNGELPEFPVSSAREQTCEERADDTAECNMFENRNTDVSELEVPQQVEGVVLSWEQPCEELTKDSQKTMLEKPNREVAELPVVSVREHTCAERVDDTAQNDVFEKTNRDVSDLEVPGQARIMDAGEQPCVGLTDDSQMIMLGKTNREELEMEVPGQAGGILNAEEQPCKELVDKTGLQNESIVSAPQIELETCEEMESDLLLEDGEAVESESGESFKESDVDADDKKKDQEANDVPDLEKMTLGEWFDYLEVYLPKQIHDATDEIVADMRKRAKQFNDFMSQQQNDKGKFSVST